MDGADIGVMVTCYTHPLYGMTIFHCQLLLWCSSHYLGSSERWPRYVGTCSSYRRVGWSSWLLGSALSSSSYCCHSRRKPVEWVYVCVWVCTCVPVFQINKNIHLKKKEMEGEKVGCFSYFHVCAPTNKHPWVQGIGLYNTFRCALWIHASLCKIKPQRDKGKDITLS